MRRAISLLALAVVSAATLHAQDQAELILESNYPQAAVYVDDVLVGHASQRQFRVPASAQRIQLAAESGESWSIAPISGTLSLDADSVYRIRMDFPHYYQIRSVPFGASVYLESGEVRRRIGETPLLYKSEQPLDSTIVVEHSGFALQRAEAGGQVWNELNLVLQPENTLTRVTELDWKTSAYSRNWIDYAAAGLAVAAGVLTVHYKFKADRLFDDYQKTGDQALRSTIKSYDTRSAIALGAMQAGVGVLAVRFVLRR